MCGIAGWLSWRESPHPEAVQGMCDAMVHRGPDAGRVVSLGPIVLGHRRLAIIDTSPENDQPQFDAAGRLCIAFNGEIYNFRELRGTLEAQGAKFRTKGDTEVLLEAYRHWGIDCLQHLNGMFAFALWDASKQRLFLARDRVGEKPLFYSLVPGGIIFASEQRALRRHPSVSRSVDPLGLAHYLTLNYTVGERCLTDGVQRLPPAHYLIQEGPATVVRPYWDLAAHFREKRDFLSEKTAAEELCGLVDDSVRLRMVSDVPLGAFLSGGVDSSTVVASMIRQYSGSVKTFSVGFGDRGFDEVDEARGVAEFLSVEHHDVRLDPSAGEWLESLIAAADEPLADSSAMPTWFLARFARQHVTVALSGDGGDECFAGYETYVADRMHSVLSKLPSWLVRVAEGMAMRFVPVTFGKVSFDYKIRQFLAGLRSPSWRAHFSWRTIFDREDLAALMHPDWRPSIKEAAYDVYADFEQHFEAVKGCHPIDQSLYVDIKTWLPDDILVKVDRASMAHSLESRAPFLDHRVVEFAASLPVSLKLKGFQKKYLLKSSQVRRLPDWVLRRKKQGFNAPVSRWLAGPMLEFAREVLGDPIMDPWFRRSAIERLYSEHLARYRDNGLRLFGLVCFALWVKAL